MVQGIKRNIPGAMLVILIIVKFGGLMPAAEPALTWSMIATTAYCIWFYRSKKSHD